MGSVDWKAFVETLKDIGYDGALTMEAVAPIDRTPVSPWTNQVEQNPVDISPEQLKFIEDHGSSLLSEEYYTMLYERPPRPFAPRSLIERHDGRRRAHPSHQRERG